MDYISFGNGEKALVIIPGLGDGLKTVGGMAVPLALMYWAYAREYRVYLFSRKNQINGGYTTRDMAADLFGAMKALGIGSADVMGVSQGGMIAQYLAIDHPEVVDRLALVVTISRQNEVIQDAVTGWIQAARRGDYRQLFIDTAERSYSAAFIRKYRFFIPVLAKVGAPKRFDRFLVQAESCLNHDSHDELRKISCPTLVIGGSDDRIVGSDASAEISGQIAGSELFVYEGLGHALYEEAKDFHARVLAFFARPER